MWRVVLSSAFVIGCAVSPFAQQADVAVPEGGPFVMGEGYAAKPATCATAKDWIGRAPKTDNRVSFTIAGEISAIHWDGALAYLIMCEEPGVQVMCVTYSKEGKNIGDTVLFGGGFNRSGQRRIMLDPCLAGPVPKPKE